MNSARYIAVLLLLTSAANGSPVPLDIQTATTDFPSASSYTPSPSPSSLASATPSASESILSKSETSLFPDQRSDLYGTGTGRVFNIYYISAVCTGLAVLALLVGGGVYRYRMRQAAVARGLIPLGEDNALPARRRPANRQKRKRVVLTEEQFNLIPCEVAHGTAPDGGGPFSSDPGDNSKAGVTEDKPAVIDISDWKEPDACAVCIEDIVAGEKLLVLPCLHSFHIDCARPWLLRKSTMCPLCKEDVRVGLGLKITEPAHDEDGIGHDGRRGQGRAQTSSRGGVATPEPARLSR